MAGLAVVAFGVAVSNTPAFARGGSAGHVGFVQGFVARGVNAGVVIGSQPAGVVMRRVRYGAIAPRSFSSCVAPALALGPSHVRLPVVMAPVCGSPASTGASTFYYPPVVTAPAPVATDAVQVSEGSVATGPDTDATNAGAVATSLPAACRPIPNGYHCDWPS
jgi:hypothetical protein